MSFPIDDSADSTPPVDEKVPSSGRRLAKGLTVMVIAMGLLAYALFNAIGNAREAAYRNSCICRLKQLGLALANYTDKHGSLPPLYTTDAQGKPLHSWRTLILPEMEEGKLYGQLRLDEPWDSPHNAKLSQQALSFYHCPREGHKSPANHTSYVAIIAPDSVWGVSQSAKLSDITDGTSKTILLVEMKNSGIHWAEPRDLDWNNLPAGVSKSDVIKALGNHAGAFNVSFGDGHVEMVPASITPAELEAMFTKSGGETIAP